MQDARFWAERSFWWKHCCCSSEESWYRRTKGGKCVCQHAVQVRTTAPGVSRSEEWTKWVFVTGFPGSWCLCVRVSSSIQPPSTDNADSSDGCVAPLCRVNTFSFLFQGGRLPSSREKKTERGWKVLLFFDFFFGFAAVQRAPADAVVRELEAVNVCLSWCETAFQGFINHLTKVKKKNKIRDSLNLSYRIAECDAPGRTPFFPPSTFTPHFLFQKVRNTSEFKLNARVFTNLPASCFLFSNGF